MTRDRSLREIDDFLGSAHVFASAVADIIEQRLLEKAADGQGTGFAKKNRGGGGAARGGGARARKKAVTRWGTGGLPTPRGVGQPSCPPTTAFFFGKAVTC